MKRKLLFSLLLVLFLIPIKTFALNEVNIYFFNSNECDYCSQERVYLEALKQRYPNIRVYSYEISDNDNLNLMKEAKEMYNITKTGVPFTVIGDYAYIGFSQSAKAIFQRKVYEYSTQAYDNKLGIKLGISYRNDLEGKVEEYKENSEYKIEETSGITRTPTKSTSKYDKYKVSFYLVGAGFILTIIFLIISFKEKRGRI